jgi:methylglutaconyl-CoA hydratase
MTRASALVRTRDERGVVTLTVDDAPTRNALGTAALAGIDQVLAGLAADPAARVLVLTGAGTVFSSGADRAELGDPALVERSTALLSSVLARIEDSRAPIVARVNGAAFGAGLAIAAAADISVAADGAVFGLPEVRFGMVAGPAAATCVPRVGRAAGLDLLLTGRRFGAAEALRIGLFTTVVDRDGLDAAIEAVIADLLAGDPVALAATRRLVRRLTPPSLAGSLAITRTLTRAPAGDPGGAP